jgi:class 3 adenylate cyclase/hemoglobin-like flavoprotein
MFRLSYPDEGVVAEVADSRDSILQVSLREKIPHVWECGGQGKCTTCRVRILDGLKACSARTPREAELAAARQWDDYTRLACQTRVSGDVTVRRLVRNGSEVIRIEAEELTLQSGKEVPLAILFADLRNFTGIVDSHPAYDIVHILNRYYARVGEAIVMNSGYIAQYVGDEIVAWFGVHGGTDAENCHNAVRAGLAMLAGLEEVNGVLADAFGLTLRTCIGVHHGLAIVANIGHSTCRQLTLIGDTINVASRIENVNRDLGTTMLISEDVERVLPVPLASARRETVRLKGKRETYRLAEVVGFRDPDPLLLVQNSFERVLGDAAGFAERFYHWLFTIEPAVRAMFRGNFDAQRRMFADVMRSIVYGLSRFEKIEGELAQEGRRHVDYGLQPDHYALFVRAFTEALRERLRARPGADDASNRQHETEEAWGSVLNRICAAMLKGAKFN